MYKSEIVRMTPEMAKKYLENNFEKNRSIKAYKVDQYASDMMSGRWDINACDPIMISETGKLLNGQHRLTALVKTGRTLIMEVRTNVPEESYVNMDQGACRTISEMIDIKQPASVSAVARIEYCLKYSNGTLVSSLRGQLGGAGSGAKRKPPHADLIRYCQQHGDRLLEYVRTGSKMKNACNRLTINQYAGFVALLKFVGDDGKLDEFVEDFCSLNSNGSVTIGTTKKKLFEIDRYRSAKDIERHSNSCSAIRIQSLQTRKTDEGNEEHRRCI